MILHNTNDAVRTSGITARHFTLEASAKAFSILSSTLYKNPILAIVRELSCNAFDAHVAAGTVTQPFEIHIPNSFEAWFSIRDYGIGLSDAQVTDIYTTYFKSTKGESNDYVGALGLGSKSPFSYANTFTVTSYYNGEKHDYAAFIDAGGIPSIAHMSTTDTDQPNGLEVKFPVKSEDFSKFRDATRSFFNTWTTTAPRFVGASIGEVTLNSVAVGEYSGSGWFIAQNNSRTTAIAIMGNVPYTISLQTIRQSDAWRDLTVPQRDAIESIHNMPLFMTFPIGELDFAASREELQYTTQTSKIVINRMLEIATEIGNQVANNITQSPTVWEATCLYSDVRGYTRACLDLISINAELTKCKCGETLSEIAAYVKRGFTIPALVLKAIHDSGAVIKENNGKALNVVPVTNDFQIVVNPALRIFIIDERSGALGKIRHSVLADFNRYNTQNILVIGADPERKHLQPDLGRLARRLTKEFGFPADKIEPTSTLPAAPKAAKKTPTARTIGVFKLSDSERFVKRGYDMHRYWGSPAPASIDATTVYIPVQSRMACMPNSEGKWVRSEWAENVVLFALKANIFAADDLVGIRNADKKIVDGTGARDVVTAVGEWLFANQSHVEHMFAVGQAVEKNRSDFGVISALVESDAIARPVTDRHPALKKARFVFDSFVPTQIGTISPHFLREIRLVMSTFQKMYPHRTDDVQKLLARISASHEVGVTSANTVRSELTQFIRTHNTVQVLIEGFTRVYHHDYARVMEMIKGGSCKQTIDLINYHLLSV
jgi:hypothetical protein